MKKFLPLVILLALLIPSFVYTIDEREQAIITEFGEFKRSVTTPGIHFKKPFVEKISRFEKTRLICFIRGTTLHYQSINIYYNTL